MKYQNLHSFKEGLIFLCQSILETRRITHLHGSSHSSISTIPLRHKFHLFFYLSMFCTPIQQKECINTSLLQVATQAMFLLEFWVQSQNHPQLHRKACYTLLFNTHNVLKQSQLIFSMFITLNQGIIQEFNLGIGSHVSIIMRTLQLRWGGGGGG